ncbi:twin-arginine translocase subunit TatC [Clostridium malenominatum]|uniref:Sec-independent protein translocase protein TatC n=1 Tax=Clostridium malenominatum TaxID=1539 RepID=A0ABN1J155_9CLOT
MAENKLTLIEHLSELRKRLFIIILSLIITSSGSYYYVEKLVKELVKYTNYLDFVYLTPSELFLTYIKISLVMGIVISSPILLRQIWLFLKPGLTKRERRYITLSLLGGVLFFAAGVIFAYLLVIPVTIKFFTGFTLEGITPTISFRSYVDFICSLLLAFGLVFEMPILSVLLTKFGLINSIMLRKNRKMVILVIFVVAAIITPPDVISQLLLAMPMMILFEISIWLSKIVGRKKEI